MSIKLNDGTTLRNLEEQVQYLTNYHDVNQGLAQWGIRVVGQVDTASELPDPSTYDGEYGDAIAVGTSAPFSFYIWTRASIEGKPAYWFPFGKISIVGPQGPKGDTGDTGPMGHSTMWYSGSSAPSSSQLYREGDMYLQTNGQIYRYHNNKWESLVNVSGPQGPQGIQGIQGPQGIQGQRGPKGDTGDVGGFINIWGIINSTSQLPTPTSLKNLTVAYLVGSSSPYNLYVQIGENSETAVWTNTGPFNVGTLISVNGSYQNVWDADTKLDKEEYDGTNKVYVTDPNQTSIELSENATANTIPKRTSTGDLKVPTTTDPLDGVAVSKSYVTRYAVKKHFEVVDSNANKNLVYACSYNSNGIPSETTYEVSSTPKKSALAQYAAGGVLNVADPADANDAVPKHILDESIATAKTQLETEITNAVNTVSDWVTVPSSTYSLFINNKPSGTTITQTNLTVRVNSKARLISINGRVQLNATGSWSTTPGFQFNLTKMKEEGYIGTINNSTISPVTVTLLKNGTNATLEPELGYIELSNSIFRVLQYESLANRRDAGTRSFYLSNTFPY